MTVAGTRGRSAPTSSSTAGSPQETELIGYAGYARRLERGWSVDAGLSRVTFIGDATTTTGAARRRTSEAVSARLHFSPNYFGQSIHTVYGELNGSYRLTDRFKLIGHAGLLQAFAGATDRAGSHPHADLLAASTSGLSRSHCRWVASSATARVASIRSDHSIPAVS